MFGIIPADFYQKTFGWVNHIRCRKNERNIDDKKITTKTDYYSRLSLCGENDGGRQAVYLL